jgi:hypothetical protein
MVFNFFREKEGFSESNIRLFKANNVRAGKISRMRGNVTWLIAL